VKNILLMIYGLLVLTGCCRCANDKVMEKTMFDSCMKAAKEMYPNTKDLSDIVEACASTSRQFAPVGNCHNEGK